MVAVLENAKPNAMPSRAASLPTGMPAGSSCEVWMGRLPWQRLQAVLRLPVPPKSGGMLPGLRPLPIANIRELIEHQPDWSRLGTNLACADLLVEAVPAD